MDIRTRSGIFRTQVNIPCLSHPLLPSHTLLLQVVSWKYQSRHGMHAATGRTQAWGLPGPAERERAGKLRALLCRQAAACVQLQDSLPEQPVQRVRSEQEVVRVSAEPDRVLHTLLNRETESAPGLTGCTAKCKQSLLFAYTHFIICVCTSFVQVIPLPSSQ